MNVKEERLDAMEKFHANAAAISLCNVYTLPTAVAMDSKTRGELQKLSSSHRA